MHKIDDHPPKEVRVVNISSLSNHHATSTLGTERTGHSKLESSSKGPASEGLEIKELKKQMMKKANNLCFKKKPAGKDGDDRYAKPNNVRDILKLKLKETSSKRAAHTPSVERKNEQSRTTFSSLSLNKTANIPMGTKHK